MNVSTDYLLGISDVRNYTEDSNITIALNSDTDYDDLPKEAKEEINNFIEYIKQNIKIKNKVFVKNTLFSLLIFLNIRVFV